MLTLTAVIHRDEDIYVAECPEVRTASQGKTIDEAAKNLKEATELYLVEFPLKSKERSFITTFEVTEVAETKESISGEIVIKVLCNRFGLRQAVRIKY